MSTSSLLRLALVISVCLLQAPRALAQDTLAQGTEPPLTVDVRAPEAVDPHALRVALERDLGVRVELVRPDASGDARVIVELTEDGTVRLRVRRDRGSVSTRETAPGADRARTTITVSLLASNLVRDESAEVLALLRPEPEPAPAEPTPPIVVEGPEPDGDATDDDAPDGDTSAEDDVSWIPVGVDFAPGLGFSTAFGWHQRRVVSLGVLGSLTRDVYGVALSSVVDLTLRDVRGVQLAGVLAYADSVSGWQGSGVVAVASNRVAGVQSSVLNVAPTLRGAQLGVANIASSVAGLQLGVLNVAAEVEGTQLGVANIAAGRVRGVQVGLFNYADDADAQIGLVNIAARGRTHLRADGDSTGLFGVSLVHGQVTHTIVSARVYPFGDRPQAALGLGLGVRAELTSWAHLDVEGITHVLIGGDAGQFSPSLLTEARVLLGLEIVPGVRGFIGLGYRFQVMHSPRSPLDEPLLTTWFGPRRPSDYPDASARGWPMLVGGVELF